MENKFSAKVYLIKEGKQVHSFNLAFKNRLIIGDVLTIDGIISGEIAFLKNECDFSDNSIKNIRKQTIDKLKKNGVSRIIAPNAFCR